MKSMYDRKMVEPMWRELADIGVRPLTTREEVRQALPGKKGTSLLMINSVCGCSAGSARPGVGIALQNEVIPDEAYTVFAGVDIEATAEARALLPDLPPSSPSVAMFKDGKLVFFMPRQEIEGHSDEEVAAKLTSVFDEHCTKTGPSVSLEQLKKAFGVA